MSSYGKTKKKMPMNQADYCAFGITVHSLISSNIEIKTLAIPQIHNAPD